MGLIILGHKSWEDLCSFRLLSRTVEFLMGYLFWEALGGCLGVRGWRATYHDCIYGHKV